MEFFDTHCHIHSKNYPLDKQDVISSAKKDGVNRLMCVGTTLEDSKDAIAFAKDRDNIWATIGLHPHDSKLYFNDKTQLDEFKELAKQPKVVAVGECGLDYFYNHSSPRDQREILEFQLQVAKDNNLPVVFHVRDAFDDFWPIYDNFKGLPGVIHSFTANFKTLEEILVRGLYVGINGIVTFTKNADQTYAASKIPLEKLVLETDSPFLTPVPFRGKVCEPRYVRLTAEFLATLRGESLGLISQATTQNSKTLFKVG